MTPERLADIEHCAKFYTNSDVIKDLLAYVRELEQLVDDLGLGRERAIAGRDAIQERVQKLEQEDAITELIAYVRELEADKAISNPDESVELVRRMTLAMREADEMFETVGGSTRHHVRECLLPVLEKHGLGISLRKAIDNARSE